MPKQKKNLDQAFKKGNESNGALRDYVPVEGFNLDQQAANDQAMQNTRLGAAQPAQQAAGNQAPNYQQAQQMPAMGAQMPQNGMQSNRPDMMSGQDYAPAQAQNDMPQVGKRVDEERLLEFTRILQKYKAGKKSLENRVISSEQWWKLRNTEEEELQSETLYKGWRAKSAWLHHTITSKHAEAMENYPQPTIRPREPNDKAEAEKLSSILPYIMESNDFEETYSLATWQKCKTGTAVYKVVWDSGKLNGLGDISITTCDLLNVFFEPGVRDIQKSRYFFHTELVDRDLLEEQYPELKDAIHKGSTFQPSKFLYDDSVSTDGKDVVIDVYYHTRGNILQYCKYVGNTVLYASENEPEYAETGYYQHGKFPYVFDTLFPVEYSPAGIGYTDLMRSQQGEIDMLQTAITRNAVVNAMPRYFFRQDGSVNETEFSDLERTLIHVDGNLGEDSIRQVTTPTLSSTYVTYLQYAIQNMRETSHNNEVNTGSTGGSVTAASAIAALQQTAGRQSAAATAASWRAYRKIVNLCIELIRQFYDIPRCFRITGKFGEDQFVQYDNRGLQPQQQIGLAGQDMGFRLPEFDIKVGAQQQSKYTQIAQNEMMLQFFQLGFFNPQLVDQALLCLDGMDFDGKDELSGKIAEQGTMAQKLIKWEQMALALAQKYDPAVSQQLSQMILQDGSMTATGGTLGGTADLNAAAGGTSKTTETGVTQAAQTKVDKAREESDDASKPASAKSVASHD